MDNIQANLASIAAAQTIAVEVHSRAQADQIAVQIRKKFGEPRTASGALWESLAGESSHDGEGIFQAAKLYLQPLAGPLTLLIDDWHGHAALGVATGNDVIRLLEESYGFVWYVTDVQMTFVLCRNDHDCLILVRVEQS